MNPMGDLFVDNFSRNASKYARFRPRYPTELYDYLERVVNRDRASIVVWDAATGNGQVAVDLAQRFSQVYATDASPQQIAHAFPHPQVIYSVCVSEATPFPPDHFDLVTVANAVHWFDIPKFFVEVQRVTRPGGVIAVWAYARLETSSETVDGVIQWCFDDLLQSYVPEQWKIIWDGYRFDFPFLPVSNDVPAESNDEAEPNFFVTGDLTLEDVVGFLMTTSPFCRFMEKNDKSSVEGLLDTVKTRLEEAWPPNTTILTMQMPLIFRMGRVA
mmetsp:Transcript_6983/g.14473  ORF Transcript_6983/g.14473 Transcript_6983/m.14473 type:complete len:272 (-) Transcript_6983:1128-1943(-)